MKGIDQCPVCQSARIFNVTEEGADIGDTIYMACLDCPTETPTIWEQVKREDLSVPNSPLSTFKKPCDNCAFRRGSPERKDPEKWEFLMQEFAYREAMFFCHKGVPLDISKGSNQSHLHPYDEQGRLFKKESRVCAGWLAWKLGKIKGQLNEKSRWRLFWDRLDNWCYITRDEIRRRFVDFCYYGSVACLFHDHDFEEIELFNKQVEGPRGRQQINMTTYRCKRCPKRLG